jgi:O-antigen/teichoic acid export membrane protein
VLVQGLLQPAFPSVCTRMALPQGEPHAAEREIRSLARGSFISLCGKLLTKSARVVSGPVMARLLGVDGYGLYCLVDTSINFAMLVLGAPLSLGTVRLVAVHDGAGEDDRASGTVVFGGVASLVAGVLVALVMTFGGARLVAEDLLRHPAVTPMLEVTFWALPLLLLGTNLASGCLGKRTVVYQEMAEFSMRVGALVGGVALVLALARTSTPPVRAFWACTGVLVGGIVTALVGLVGMHRCFPRLKFGNWRLCDVAGLLGVSLPFVIILVSEFGVGRVNVFLAGLWLSTQDVAVYGALVAVTFVDSLGLSVVGGILQPTIADLYERGEMEKLQSVFFTATRWVSHLTLPLIVFCMLKAHSIMGVFGPTFVVGTLALQIAYLGQAVNASAGHTRCVLGMARGQWVLAVTHTVAMFSNLVLCYLLVKVHGMGLMGFAVSSSISVALSALLPMVAIRCQHGLRTYCWRSAKPVAAAVIAAPVLLWHPGGIWTDLAVGFALYVAAYVAASLALGLEPEDQMLLQRVAARFHRPSASA